MKKILSMIMAIAILATMTIMPAFAEDEKAAGWNNVNAEGYTFQDYSGKTLTFMWWGSDTRAKLTTQVIELYEEKTGIKIDYQWYDGTTYWTQFQAMMAAGTLPDVFQMGNNWATYYDTIQPLNEYIESGLIDTTNISAAMLATTTNQANGDVTGISNGTNARCFAYNPAIFDECGVAYPTDTWTWDDFAAAARTITEKTGNPAITTLEYQTLIYSYVSQYTEGANFYAMDGSDFDFGGDTTSIAKIMDLLVTLMKEGVIGDYGIQNEIGTNIEADWIATGDAAMIMLSSNQFQALSNVAAENGISLKLATLPRVSSDGPSGMLVRSSQQLSIYANSEQKEIAADFINFFENSVEANEILKCERGVSINSEVLNTLIADNPDDSVNNEIYSMINLIGSFPDAANNSPAEPTANEEITNVLKQTYVQGLYYGNFASAQEAADAFWAEAQEIWAKYAAQ